jgi:hypothetical protein
MKINKNIKKYWWVIAIIVFALLIQNYKKDAQVCTFNEYKNSVQLYGETGNFKVPDTMTLANMCDGATTNKQSYCYLHSGEKRIIITNGTCSTEECCLSQVNNIKPNPQSTLMQFSGRAPGTTKYYFNYTDNGIKYSGCSYDFTMNYDECRCGCFSTKERGINKVQEAFKLKTPTFMERSSQVSSGVWDIIVGVFKR